MQHTNWKDFYWSTLYS